MQLIILTFLPVKDAFCSAQNAPKPFSAPDPSREVYDAPRSPSWMGMAMPPPHKSPSSMLDLSVVAASKSVPNFHHRFMVTITHYKYNTLKWLNTICPQLKYFQSLKRHFQQRSGALLRWQKLATVGTMLSRKDQFFSVFCIRENLKFNFWLKN